MDRNQLKAQLTALGVTFANNASESTLANLLKEAKLAQLVSGDEKSFSFDSTEVQNKIKAQKEREYPDFGRDVPEGEYTLTGKGTIHNWHNPRTDRNAEIFTAFLQNGEGDVFEVAFAAFSTREFKFMQFDGRDAKGNINYKEVTTNCVLPFTDSLADRNSAVLALGSGLKVSVHHARGHFDNPYNNRVFDFVYTWLEKA